ncbi:hypothetical protein SELMODRAFT_427422 [Selaginella moellendorffii]|uniref:Uncharacterized protein n=1 Tax=Selaginella moellendorffii TaxID=88036 RepID=D8SZJ3_SELML|nr:hypothetical protein SELMODRAFT_427422 [Selaginella moellendorffii]
MEIESQLEDVKKRIKDLETCLEGSVDDDMVNSMTEEDSGESSESVMFGTHAIPVAWRNYKTSVEEFRETLKALENLELEQKNSIIENCRKQRIEAYEQKDKRKTEDLDVLKNFIASGWGLLTAEGRKESPVGNGFETKGRSTGKIGHAKSGTDDESQQIKTFRHRMEDSRRREAKRDEILHCAGGLEKSETSTLNVTDLERLKKEVKLELKAHEEAWRSQHARHVEDLVDKRAEKFISQQFKTFVAGTEKALSDMKSELSLVRNEMKCVDKARGGLQKEQETLRYETKRIRMEVHNACESLKDNDIRMEDCCHRISKLVADGAEIKEQIAELKCLDYRKFAKTVQADGFATKTELQAFKNEHEAISGRILIEAEKEKAVIMDRVEHLSQLYLGGLEDVKAEVSSLKVCLDSSSSARSELLLAEMKRRNKKCLQLESSMREKVETTAKLYEKYNMGLQKLKEEWSFAVENFQLENENPLLGTMARENIVQAGNTFQATRLEQTAIVNRIQNLEESVANLAKTSLCATNDPLIFANIEKHHEVTQSELHRLDDQMRSTLRKLDHIDTNFDNEKYSSLCGELENLGQKVRDATKSRTVILDKMSEMGKKIRKIENTQNDFIRSIKEVRASASDLEKQITTWEPKYDTLTGQLKDMNERLAAAESFMTLMGSDGGEGPETVEASSTTACVELLHTRVDTLEGRVEHVASATITNLRILDSKVEHYRVGVQSAIEGAALAESKCGVLGAELVKVFRMLAARNGKLNDQMTGRKSPVKTDCPTTKVHESCRHCKKSEEFPDDGQELENGFSSYGCSDIQRQHLGPTLNESSKAQSRSCSFIESYAESFYESGKNFKKQLASSKKLNLTSADRKDHKIGCKSCQRTNIRLEAGRIHVNVCHRVAGANRKRPDNVLLEPQKPLY